MSQVTLGAMNDSATAETLPVVQVVREPAARAARAGKTRPRSRSTGTPLVLRVQVGGRQVAGEQEAGELAKALETFIPLFVSTRTQRKAEQVAELAQLLGGNVAIRPLDERVARGFAKAKQAILEGTSWLTAAEVAQLSGGSVAERPEKRVYAWRDRGKLFSLRLDDGTERFPLYAFDQGGQPHEALQAILVHLGPINAWRIAAWFNGGSRALGGRAPRELLESDPQAVLQAASHYRDYPV